MATTIERDDAITQVAQRVAANSTPKLTSVQVEQLVDAAARPDRDGTAVGEDGWLPTYDLDAAAQQGWELKAGEAANRFDIAVDRQDMTRSQIIDHCLKMADRYRSRRAGTIVRI